MANPNPNTSGLIPFGPGNNANPSGRPKGSKSPAEALRSLSGERHTEAELRKVADDPAVHAIKRAAARQILDSLTADQADERGKAFDRVADRLDGKPTQAVTVEAPQPPTVAQALARARAELVARPRKLLGDGASGKVTVRTVEPGEAEAAPGDQGTGGAG